MSNSYTKAAFDLTVTVAEADMLRRVIATVELIDDTEAGIDVREAHYTSLGPDFAALFPRSDEDPFAGVLDLFEDPQYPYLDFDVAFSDPHSRPGQAGPSRCPARARAPPPVENEHLGG